MKLATTHDFSPINLMQLGDGFLSLWRRSIQAHKSQPLLAEEMVATAHVLFFAIELYLKALLAAKNRQYAKTQNGQKSSHNFNKIYEELGKYVNSKQKEVIRTALKKYNLFEADYMLLRYPKQGVTSFHPDLFTENHGFEVIFDLVRNEVAQWAREWHQGQWDSS